MTADSRSPRPRVFRCRCRSSATRGGFHAGEPLIHSRTANARTVRGRREFTHPSRLPALGARILMDCQQKRLTSRSRASVPVPPGRPACWCVGVWQALRADAQRSLMARPMRFLPRSSARIRGLGSNSFIIVGHSFLRVHIRAGRLACYSREKIVAVVSHPDGIISKAAEDARNIALPVIAFGAMMPFCISAASSSSPPSSR